MFVLTTVEMLILFVKGKYYRQKGNLTLFELQRHLLIKMNNGPDITFTTKQEKTMIGMSLINSSV